MILSVSHRVKSMSSQKKSNYIPFIVSLEHGYCLLLSPIKPFSHCFLPKTTNERQRGTSKVRQDRAGSETLAGPGSSVIAQQEIKIKGRVRMTQTLSLVTIEFPRSTSQARWHQVGPKASQVYGQEHHTSWAAAPLPTMSQPDPHSLYRSFEMTVSIN